jgi:hypothetical protein
MCPFSTDIVCGKIEYGECLYGTIVVDIQSIRRKVVLPRCSAMLEPDDVLLQDR